MNLSQYARRFLDNYIIPLYTEIEKVEFVVHPRLCYAYEYSFLYENVDNDELYYSSDAILEQLNKKIPIQEFLLYQATSKLEFNREKFAANLRKMWGGQISLSNPDFDFYFALTLRQTSTDRISDFFEFQINHFETTEKFIAFLESLLIGQEALIPEKNKQATRLWVEAQRLKSFERPISLTIPFIQIQSKDNNLTLPSSQKTVKESENRPFTPSPFQAFDVPGRLNPKIIRRFFTFLSKETNGTDQPFATNEAIIKHLESYGLQVPLSPLPERFDLNLGGKRTRQVIYYCFYELYSKHSSNEKHKQYFAMLLKYTFTNFDNITSIENLASHIRPYELSPKQMNFDIGQYLRKSD